MSVLVLRENEIAVLSKIGPNYSASLFFYIVRGCCPSPVTVTFLLPFISSLPLLFYYRLLPVRRSPAVDFIPYAAPYMMDSGEEFCVICEQTSKDTVSKVTEKGLPSLLKYSKDNGLDHLTALLSKRKKEGTPIHVHRGCQKKVSRVLGKRKSIEEETKVCRKTKRSGGSFDWREDCFYCGKNCVDSGKYPGRSSAIVYKVQNISMQEIILKACNARDDLWADEVRHRVINCYDLVAVGARYHKACRNRFNAVTLNNSSNSSSILNSTVADSNALEITSNITDSILTPAAGRPIDNIKHKEFEILCDWLEEQTDLVSMKELHEELIKIAGKSDVYTSKWLKNKLKTKYGTEIHFSTMDGRCDVICFRSNADKLLNDMWYLNKKDDAQEECERVITTTAKLIINDVKSATLSCATYPTAEEIESVDFGVQWLPPFLRLMMEKLLQGLPVKQASLGQAIVHAMRPRSSIPPILFGTAIEMDHMFGSKWLNTELARLAYSLGHDEIVRYKQSVLCNETIEEFIKTSKLDGMFGQWSADNVDHNVATLDGKGTLHGMGIVLSLTGSKDKPAVVSSSPMPRTKINKVDHVTKRHQIDILPYVAPQTSGLSQLKFSSLTELKTIANNEKPRDAMLDLLWHASHFTYLNDGEGRPGWSGYMSQVCKGEYPGKSTVITMPIIDLNPGDMSCIYSTMMFVMKQAKDIGIKVPILTFDQPLWLKATEIAKALSLDIVLILGGFHMMMSFVGSIGDIMTDSGMAECFETSFGTNAVKHMLTGKAISRSLRAHLTLERALTNELMKDFFPQRKEDMDETNQGDKSCNDGTVQEPIDEDDDMNEEEVEDCENHDDRDDEINEDDTEDFEDHDNDQINEDNVEDSEDHNSDDDQINEEEVKDSGDRNDYSDLHSNELDMNGDEMESESIFTDEDLREIVQLCKLVEDDFEKGMEAIDNSDLYQKLIAKFEDRKEVLKLKSRTSKYWIQYIDYVDILKDFLRAERTGNFTLHLQTVSRMINLFAATGHIYYAKCARMHLQQMLELETKYPWVYDKFAKEGYHTVRRTDKYWNGLWTDLIIEQVLMRSLKSRGGLTRGRGVSESTRTMWVGTMHRCAQIHNAMCNLTGLQHKSSEQHVELTTSRLKRDNKDLNLFKSWIQQHNPFDENNSSLRSLTSGLTAKLEDNINCDDAEIVGESIQKRLNGVSMEDASIPRKDQARTLDNLKAGIKVNDTEIKIDPLILFCRIATLLEREEEEKQIRNFDYELTPEPTSLFKDGKMRKAAKSKLRNHLIKFRHRLPNRPNADVCVVDGGAALYHTPWPLQCTYGDLADYFIDHIKSKHGRDSAFHVIFDGYDTNYMSFKTAAQAGRCSNVTVAADVTVTADTKVTIKRDEFLRNTHNKEQFIQLVSEKLQEKLIANTTSVGDADTLIAKTALEYAKAKQNVIVASDDTDVLVLLLHHWKASMGQIAFATEREEPSKKRRSSRKRNTVMMWWSIGEIIKKEKLEGIPILLAHAWCGCDTTSAIHNRGKVKILQALRLIKFRETVNAFGNSTSTQEEIMNAAIHMALKTYGGKDTDTLGSLRHAKYNQMVNEKSKFQPENLPPTERAAFYHGLRVHLQVSVWQNLDLHCLDPRQWGWEMRDGKLVPIMTDLDAAPEYLLKVVRCNCKTTSTRTCGKNTCSCRKNGLRCTSACGDCRGISCCNIAIERTGIEIEE